MQTEPLTRPAQEDPPGPARALLAWSGLPVHILPFALIGLGLLNNTYSTALVVVGFGSLLASLVVSGSVVLANPIPVAAVRPWLPIGVVYLVALVRNPAPAAWKYFIQLAAVATIFVWAWLVRPDPGLRRGLVILRGGLLAFGLVGLVISLLEPDSEIFTNANMVGAVAASAVFVDSMIEALEEERRDAAGWARMLALPLGVLLLSGARSALLAVLTFGGTLAAWRFISAGRVRFWAVFLAAVLGVAGVTVALAELSPSIEVFEMLQEQSERLTNKNLGTRTSQWSAVLPEILERPLDGWGLDRQAGDAELGDPELSAHSQYLELALKTGFPGLVALASALALLWYRFWTGRARRDVAVAAATLLAVMVHQTFEVNLLHTGLALGAIWWTLLGLGAGDADLVS